MDTLLSVFQFGTPSFVQLREQIWLSVFEAAARDDISTIFTFAPESTVDPGFIDKAVSTIQNAGGEICFVKLDCPVEVIESRLSNPSREHFLKLKVRRGLSRTEAKKADHFPELPTDLSLDTSVLSPEQSARKICQEFEIPILSELSPVEHYPEAVRSPAATHLLR